jgi:hypothetical protein
MNKIFSIIKRLDRKYALSFVTGLIFGGFSIYVTFFYSKKPDLHFEVLNNSNVIDIHENIGDLEIKYKNKDILKDKKSLRMYIVRVANNGSLDINKSFYDDRDPAGIDILNGTIVNKVEIIESNTDYLTKSINPISYNEKSITLLEPILNVDDYFTIKVLVLHNIKQIPEIKTKGRILGINKIEIISSSDKSQNKSIWTQIWEGNIGIYILRFFCYLISCAILCLVIILPIIYMSEYFSKRYRKKIVKSYRSNNTNISKMLSCIIDRYIDTDFGDLRRIHELINDTSKIKKIISNHNFSKENFSYSQDVIIKTVNDDNVLFSPGYSFKYFEFQRVSFLLNKKIITNTDGNITIPDKFITELNRFFEFVKIKNT